MELPHAGPVAGMGIRPGVTLLVGGGFHQINAAARFSHGVYNHRPNDERHQIALMKVPFLYELKTALRIRS